MINLVPHSTSSKVATMQSSLKNLILMITIGLSAILPGGLIVSAETVYNQASLKRPLTRERYPLALSNWGTFLGFDYSQAFKQVYTYNNYESSTQGLLLSARQDYPQNPLYDPNSNDPRINKSQAIYSGGRLELKEKFQYGHIQIKAKLPNNPGLLPALWLIGDGSQGYGEIDIAEAPGNDNRAYATTHYGANPTDITTEYREKTISNIGTRFHYYDIYRFPDLVVILYDGILVYEFNPEISRQPNGQVPLNQPMTLVLNVAVHEGWAKAVDPKQLPGIMEVSEIFVGHYN